MDESTVRDYVMVASESVSDSLPGNLHWILVVVDVEKGDENNGHVASSILDPEDVKRALTEVIHQAFVEQAVGGSKN